MLVAGFPAADVRAPTAGSWPPAPGRSASWSTPASASRPTSTRSCSASTGCSPVAVLLTHGHLDHTFSVTPVCGRHGHPGVRPPGRPRTGWPTRCRCSSPEPAARSVGGLLTWTEPDDVRDARPTAPALPLAGLEVTVDHAPGHTEGSVLFRLPPARATSRRCCAEPATSCSPGRSAAPTCPAATTPRCCRSLRDKVLPLRRRDGRAARPRADDHDRPRAGAPTRTCGTCRRGRAG